MSVKSLFNAFRDQISLQADEVVVEFFEGFDWNLSERSLEPRKLPVSAVLDQLVEHAGPGQRNLVREFVEAQELLRWGQTYTKDDFGENFIQNYGWVEMIGERGHFVSSEIAAGFLLYNSGLLYPEHYHVAEEIYIPLTGNGSWSRDGSEFLVRKPGEIIHHSSNTPHANRAGGNPLLVAYMWRDGDLTQKSNY